MRQSEACRSVLKKKFSASVYNMMVYDNGAEGMGGSDTDDDMMTMTKSMFGGVSLCTKTKY